MAKEFEDVDQRRGVSRRQFIGAIGKLCATGVLSGGVLRVFAAEDKILLPFQNGERRLVKYPQKRPLIQLTARPPQLETPFSVLSEGIITPNDAFFVRYHLSGIPTSIDLNGYRISVEGKVKSALRLSVKDLKTKFDSIELVAVNQCSGNSRGFFDPRVGGGQLGHGAMGNARWKGVPLREVLNKAGVVGGAKQVIFNGLDKPVLGGTPDFVKALDLDHALDGEVMLAYSMNGEDLPLLNGYPVRLVVPGYYGTYWVKHLSHIKVIDQTFDGYWMDTAYRIPDNDCACIEPGTLPKKTKPIARFNTRSFITSPKDGQVLKAGQDSLLEGIAFDGGHGIEEVVVSMDGGQTWQEAQLGKDFGKYSFRGWKMKMNLKKAGTYQLKVRASNTIGQSQPLVPQWNSTGYMRNVVETTQVSVL